MTEKNRNRSPYTFANINLLGKCNVDCYFCLGKDLEEEFAKYQTLQTHWTEWGKWDEFIDMCRKYNIPQIYITGQNADGLQYKYLKELIEEIKNQGFHVGIRTNGLLAKKKIDIINSCTTCWGDAISYSVHTLNKDTQIAIWKTPVIPDWDWIFKNTKSKMRVSIVVTRYNYLELPDILKFLSKYDNIEYIQVRKVCTDNRHELLSIDMDAFELVEGKMRAEYECIGSFESANVYMIHGKKVSFWKTVGTTVNSINYFTNGVLSDEYFIIEGYEKYKENMA